MGIPIKIGLGKAHDPLASLGKGALPIPSLAPPFCSPLKLIEREPREEMKPPNQTENRQPEPAEPNRPNRPVEAEPKQSNRTDMALGPWLPLGLLVLLSPPGHPLDSLELPQIRLFKCF